MKLEYYGIDKANLKSGIDLNAMLPGTREKIISKIESKQASTMLDWIDLPDMSNVEIVDIENIAGRAKNCSDFVVLGIGGSALGIKMLKDTFVDSINIETKTKVHVCDNIDGDKFVTMLSKLNLRRTMFNVITKSGTTSETLAQMLIVIGKYRELGVDFRKHFIVTTSLGNDLYNFATENNIPVLIIPNGVGGRFSVLSAVGLLPACVMGIDIRKLLHGAKKARANAFKKDESNIAYTCAYINYTYLKKGLTNLVTMPYSDRLSLLPEFFAQLWAESLGKKYNLKGVEVDAGQTPIKTLGVTDQHSQLQLYSEGIRDKLIMFIRVNKHSFDEKVNYELPFTKHLTGTTLNTLMSYEFNATAYSLTTVDRPNYTIVLNSITEETIGELIMMVEMMTAFMGGLLGIDAFNQPGVELSKSYTKAMLGTLGVEEKTENIKKYISDKNNFVI